MLLVALGVGFLTGKQAALRPWLLRALPLWLVTAAWVAQPDGPLPADTGAALGGIVGYYLAQGFAQLFGPWGVRIFLTVFLLVAVIAVSRPWLGWVPGFAGRAGIALAALGRGLRALGAGPLAAVGRGLAWLVRQPAALLADRPRRRPEADEAEDLDDHRAAAEGETNGGAPAARRPRTVHDESLPGPAPVAAPPPVEVRELPGAAGEFVGDEDPDAAAAASPVRRKPKRRAAGPVDCRACSC